MNRPIVLALALLAGTWAAPAATTTTAQHKTTKRRHHATTPAGATTASKARASKTTASKKSTSKKTAARHGKKTHHTARSYQQAPTPDRYREIQQALAGKGYYHGEVNGQWSAESVGALKRFQADQNLMPDGKLNSLSLIALGLGPKRLTAKSDSSVPPLAAPKAEPSR